MRWPDSKGQLVTRPQKHLPANFAIIDAKTMGHQSDDQQLHAPTDPGTTLRTNLNTVLAPDLQIINQNQANPNLF